MGIDERRWKITQRHLGYSNGEPVDRTMPEKSLRLFAQCGVDDGFTANEMLFAGIDPNTIRFKRAGCFDVGLECGG